jgi:predicted MFS family arabinose efflux permease
MNTAGYRWVIAGLSVLAVMGALGFARFGYTMILPGMKEGLALSEVQAGDLATGNMIGYLIFSVAGGMIASRFGPRVLIPVSLACVAGAMALTGVAADYRSALAARVLTGMASGGANVPVLGLLSSWFSSRQRGLATGIAVSGSSFGLLFTGLAVPLVLQRYGSQGWRYAWFLFALVTAGVTVLCALALRNGPTRGSRAEESDSPRRLPWSSIFSSGSIWSLACIYVFFGFSYIVYATFFVRYLTAEAGYSVRAAGALWSFVGALSVASGFFWGSVSDRLGRRAGLVGVFSLQLFAFVVFGLWKASPGPVLSAVLFAITAWSVPAIMAAAAGDLLGARLAPGALGFLTLFFGLGQVAGPFAAGRIAHATGSYTAAFLAAGAASLAGAALSLGLRIGKSSARGSAQDRPS